jgi:trimeric autotransporter adhesin
MKAKTTEGNSIMKTRNKNTFITIVLALVCFAFSPQTRAACDSPDPGCPGGNLAEGTGALLSLTTGTYNTAIGFLSLGSNTEGGFNTGVGAGTLLANTVGGRNTAAGAGALLSNTAGPANTGIGAFALFSNTEGGYNTAVGDRALLSHTAGDRNTAIGASALLNDTTGTRNTAIGAAVLFNNSTGEYNTAVGDDTLAANTSGSFNTAIGTNSLYNNTRNGNTAVGYFALYSNTTGEGNTALGTEAGSLITTGSRNIDIGNRGFDTDTQTIRIGDSQTSTFIAGIFDQASFAGTAVLINSAGKLGTTMSSRRFKDEIKPMDKTSESILALKPVTFHYKSDKTNRPQFGLVAEEVAQVNSDLVVRDGNGEIYTVRYDAVNAMLLNEFLKEHKRVETLETTVEQQRKDFEAAVTQLKTEVHKVSAQLELSKPAPQTALNNR